MIFICTLCLKWLIFICIECLPVSVVPTLFGFMFILGTCYFSNLPGIPLWGRSGGFLEEDVVCTRGSLWAPCLTFLISHSQSHCKPLIGTSCGTVLSCHCLSWGVELFFLKIWNMKFRFLNGLRERKRKPKKSWPEITYMTASVAFLIQVLSHFSNVCFDTVLSGSAISLHCSLYTCPGPWWPCTQLIFRFFTFWNGMHERPL